MIQKFLKDKIGAGTGTEVFIKTSEGKPICCGEVTETIIEIIDYRCRKCNSTYMGPRM